MNTIELTRTTEYVEKKGKISIVISQHCNKYTPVSHSALPQSYHLSFCSANTNLKRLKLIKTSNPLFLETVNPEVFIVCRKKKIKYSITQEGQV